MSPLMVNPGIQTHSGIMVDLVEPTANMICIEDIAHALSQICRFTGHLNQFYSVAQHSLMVCDLLPDELKLTGLLHDAAEAYTGDMASPLKSLCREYRLIQENFEQVIANKYNLVYPFPAEVKITDMQALVTEAEQLFLYYPYWIKDYIKLLDIEIIPVGPIEAERLFMDKFNELMEK